MNGRNPIYCPNWDPKRAQVEMIDTSCGRCTNYFELGIDLDEDQEAKKPSFWGAASTCSTELLLVSANLMKCEKQGLIKQATTPRFHLLSALLLVSRWSISPPPQAMFHFWVVQ